MSATSMTKAVPKAQLRCVVVDTLVATRRRGAGAGSVSEGVLLCRDGEIV